MLSKLFLRQTSLSLSQWLLLSCGFSCLLLIGRMIVTDDSIYRFLVWNLFLAWIPFAISQWLTQRRDRIKSLFVKCLVLFTWLLFIPNSFYILTDLFHLAEFDNAPKWFDLLLVFSFAWNGLLLGILSVRKIEIILTARIGGPSSLLFVFGVMWLNAFGIYIGRYLRYNSWDVVAQPFSLFSELLAMVFHPVRNHLEWGMVTIYAVFMTIVYMSLRKSGELREKSITH